MFRRQAYALAAIASLLTLCSLALSGLDAGALNAGRARRMAPFPWSGTVKAVIRRAGGTVSLFRDGDGRWKVELPHGAADDLSPDAEDALAAFAALAWREPVSGREAPGGAAPVLALAGADGTSVAIAFGEVRDGLRSAAVTASGDGGGGGAVYGVHQDLAAFLDWPEERFRSLLLASGGGTGRDAQPDRIRLSPADPARALDILLERRDAGWIMTEPVVWPVDENRLELLLRWLQRLRAEGIAAEMTGDPEYFGFDGRVPFVEARYPAPEGEAGGDGGARIRRVEFGAPVDGDAPGTDARGAGRIYARETGRSPVFVLPRDAMAEISLDIAPQHPEAWRHFFRRRSLDRLGGDSPAWICVEQLLPRYAKLTLALADDAASSGTAEPGGWTGTLEADGRTRSFAVDPPDGRDGMRPLAALCTGLASLRVKNFLAESPPGPETAAWTAHPAWRFSLRTADGRELPGLTLYARDAEGRLPAGDPFIEGEAEPRELKPLPGVAAGAGMAFSVPDRAAVMETFSELSYLLCLPLYRYQSRDVVRSDPSGWTRVDIVLAGKEAKTLSYTRKAGDPNEQWLRGGAAPEPLLDDNNRFVSLLLRLSRLKAEAFVRDVSGEGANFGLDRPAITAIVYSSSGSETGAAADAPLFVLALGDAADASGKRFARLGGDGPVFTVPGGIADALETEYR